MAAELAEQMLPSITTVEVKPETFSGEGLVAWRPDLDLNAQPRQGEAQMPNTILVLNPGDVEVRNPLPREQPNPQAAPPPAEDFIDQAMRRMFGGGRGLGRRGRGAEQDVEEGPAAPIESADA